MESNALVESRKLIKGIDVKNNRYEILGLERNPFPAGGLAPSNPQYEPWPEIREKIIGFIESFLVTKHSRGLMLLGGYGTGKTYHLNYIRTVLLDSPHKIRIVSVNDPGLDPYQIIRRILIEIGEEEVATMIWSIIAPELKRRYINDPGYFDNMIRSKSRAKQAQVAALYLAKINFQSITESGWSDHRVFFEQIDKGRVLDRKELLSEVVPILTSRNSETFVTDIVKIAEDLASICIFDGVHALERWKGLTEGVGKGSIESGNEVDFLTALLELLKRSGIDYFVLLLDEFEKVPQLQRMTERDARNYLDTLRILIDGAHQQLPFAYIVGSIEDAWDLAKDKVASLEDRFDVIELPRMLNNEIAKYTILQYLNSVRITSDEDEDKGTLNPFPENFLDLIPADARRTARQLVKLCYRLIEQAIEKGESHISEESVKLIVSNSHTSDEQELEE